MSKKAVFKKFVALLPTDGLLIAHLDDANVAEIAAEANCEVQGYGLDSSRTWSIDNIKIKNGISHFNVTHDGQPYSHMTVGLPGQHNCLNSLAVIAIMHHLGIEPLTINAGLESFAGVKRRQEVRGTENGITVIDDFAHHPTAVRETLHALKSGYQEHRLVTVFEPRTNSSRRAIFQEDYASSFEAADLVILREPAPIEGLETKELFSSAKLAKDLTEKHGLEAQAFPTTDLILEKLKDVLKEGDVVAILSNGGFDNIHTRLLEQIRESTLP